MGFLDRLKGKTAGVLTDARPQEGVAPAAADDVRRRLEQIAGKGITTRSEDGEVVVAWAAKVASVGAGADYEYRYRAIRVQLDPERHEASGVCLKTDTHAELGLDATLSVSSGWERGQFIGPERMTVLAWLGPHSTSGGADEGGFTFSWGDLRGQVVEAVTGAGWTYRPRKA